jgi:predicted phage tail protein
MVNVKLHGVFENFIETNWSLNVKSIIEVFQAIEANTGKLISTLGNINEYISYFIIYVDDKIVAPEYLNSPILKRNSKVEVIPLILGSAEQIIIGLILLAISTGIQMLITKLLTPESPTDIKTVSRLFSGYENVSLRNVSIPIGYGRLKIGSIVIANDIYFTMHAEDKSSNQTIFYVAKEVGALSAQIKPKP